MVKITSVSHFKQMLLYNLKLVKIQQILKNHYNKHPTKKKKIKKIKKQKKNKQKAKNGFSFLIKIKKCITLFLKFI